MTYYEKLVNAFPNLQKIAFTSSICPQFVFGGNAPTEYADNCIKQCDACWNREIEEVK